ncbi:hypothetical protein JY96_11365 [Aquabacterium sp. NJ1]|uniref:hypothetical protein n=1 Tax=Aquabacterium sp. NJ1 TaxID=1538295 RepID=UPI00052DA6EE|nr:hypothetical protein [Aquabacterium sp. NJ1]KGM40437.1 hypothetical protein JY96_11365 [Aquabacterium sp. NJ1]
MDETFIPVCTVARHMWETNKPTSWFAPKLGKGERYLRQLLEQAKPVPIQMANQVSSFSDTFSAPITSDQPPVIVFSRQIIRSAESLEDVDGLVAQLKKELRNAKERDDVNLQALLNWQMLFACHKACSFLGHDDAGKALKLARLESAAEYGHLMRELLPRTTFFDGALFRFIERRNWATTAFLLSAAQGGPSKGEILQYIAAYDDAWAAVNQTILDVSPNQQNRDVVLDVARLPMRRALSLDRVELAAYVLDEADLVQRCISDLLSVSTYTGPRVLQLALESIPKPARDALNGVSAWVAFTKEVNAKVFERASSRVKRGSNVGARNEPQPMDLCDRLFFGKE